MKCPRNNTGSDIKNNAGIENINLSPSYQKILNFIQEHSITHNNVFDFVKDDSFVQESIKSGKFLGMDIEELRKLKQPINNQICLPTYERFLEDISHINEDEIPITIRKKQSEILGFEGISAVDFLRGNHRNLPTIAKVELSDKYPPMSLEFINKKKSRIRKILGIGITYETLLIKYLELFWKNIVFYYQHSIGHGSEGEFLNEGKNITIVFYFLEYFITHHINEEYGYNGSSSPSDIGYSSNLYTLKRYLKYAEINSKIDTSIEGIKDFLKNQGKETAKVASSTEKTLYGKCNHVIYNNQRNVFKIIEGEVPQNHPWVTFGQIDGCTFLKTRLSNGNNAFSHMFETFDDFFIKIARALEEEYKTK